MAKIFSVLKKICSWTFIVVFFVFALCSLIAKNVFASTLLASFAFMSIYYELKQPDFNENKNIFSALFLTSIAIANSLESFSKTYFVAGAAFLIISALVFPLTSRFIENKLSMKLTVKKKTIFCIILFLIAAFSINPKL